MQKIVMLRVDQLHPHPDNPRKDLGDLTELADSIKAKGVLQNLTVVPFVSPVHKRVMEGLYTIIIGHRRHSAAKLAGLTELPCVIAEMDDKEQVETMAMENIQRSDLTPREQGDCFQMMLDMGSTPAELAKKTGFSETTIRNRAKLTMLDKDKFKKAEKRGGTMEDYLKLTKITDEARRNKVLEFVGTAEFNQKYKAAMDDQEVEKFVADALAELDASDWCKKRTDENCGASADYVYHCCVDRWNRNPIARPADAGDVPYVYFQHSPNSVSIYRKNVKREEEPLSPEELRKQAYHARIDAIDKELRATCQTHYELREEFVRTFNAVDSNEMVIQEFAAQTMIVYPGTPNQTRLGKLLGIPVKNADKYNATIDKDALARALFHRPGLVLMCAAYAKMDSASGRYFNSEWDGDFKKCVPVHHKDRTLDKVYKFLEQLGYEMCEEERLMQSGTHPLFIEAKKLVEDYKKGEPFHE